jgi:hypothetical protein
MRPEFSKSEKGVIGASIFIILGSLVAVLLFGCKPTPTHPVDDEFTLLRSEIFAHMREALTPEEKAAHTEKVAKAIHDHFFESE